MMYLLLQGMNWARSPNGLFVRGGNVISAEGYKIEAEDESFSEIIEQFLLQFYHDAGAYAA